VQPHQTVIDELQSSDIVIQPSVTAKNGDSEGGAPTIILEAQACGIPIVSTNHADIPYITCPDKSALLSDERDIEGLVHNLNYLFDNPNSWSKMGKIGRDHVVRFHDIKKEVLRLEDIYKKCVKTISN
jgi:colanic acid/amylovoran biosynthesis glycosyltransferase